MEKSALEAAKVDAEKKVKELDKQVMKKGVAYCIQEIDKKPLFLQEAGVKSKQWKNSTRVMSFWWFLCMVCILQNQLLLDRLEGVHIVAAETERKAAGILSDSGQSSEVVGESDLQNVIRYLRRSKETVCFKTLVHIALYLFFLSV